MNAKLDLWGQYGNQRLSLVFNLRFVIGVKRNEFDS